MHASADPPHSISSVPVPVVVCLLLQQTNTNLANTSFPAPTFSSRPALSNMLLARTHPKWRRKTENVQAGLTEANTTPTPAPWKREDTHISLTVAQKVRWGQTSGLTAGPIHNQSFSGENTDKMPYSLVLPHLWKNASSDSTQSQGPDDPLTT